MKIKLVILFIAVAFSQFGCVKRSAYDELTAQNESLIKTGEQLQARLSEQQIQITSLNDQIHRDTERGNKRIEELSAKIVVLVSSLEAKEAELKLAEIKNAELKQADEKAGQIENQKIVYRKVFSQFQSIQSGLKHGVLIDDLNKKIADARDALDGLIDSGAPAEINDAFIGILGHCDTIKQSIEKWRSDMRIYVRQQGGGWHNIFPSVSIQMEGPNRVSGVPLRDIDLLTYVDYTKKMRNVIEVQYPQLENALADLKRLINK